MGQWRDPPDRAAEPGEGQPGGGGRRGSGGRRVFLVAAGLMLVLLGGTALFVPLSPASAANGGVIVFVPLGPSSTAISVWQAHDLCTRHAGAVGPSLSGSWAGPCPDVAPVWGASLLGIAVGLVLLLVEPVRVGMGPRARRERPTNILYAVVQVSRHVVARVAWSVNATKRDREGMLLGDGLGTAPAVEAATNDASGYLRHEVGRSALARRLLVRPDTEGCGSPDASRGRRCAGCCSVLSGQPTPLGPVWVQPRVVVVQIVHSLFVTPGSPATSWLQMVVAAACCRMLASGPVSPILPTAEDGPKGAPQLAEGCGDHHQHDEGDHEQRPVRRGKMTKSRMTSTPKMRQPHIVSPRPSKAPARRPMLGHGVAGATAP